MLVINNRSLNGKADVVHKRSAIGTEISMTVALGKFFLCFLNSFLFLLGLLVFGLFNDVDV